MSPTLPALVLSLAAAARMRRTAVGISSSVIAFTSTALMDLRLLQESLRIVYELLLRLFNKNEKPKPSTAFILVD